MKRTEFKKALEEASQWQDQLTKKESTKISYSEARKRILERIFNRFWYKEPEELCDATESDIY